MWQSALGIKCSEGHSSECYSSLRQVNFGVPKGSGLRLLCLLMKTAGYHGRIWQRSSLTCSNLSGWGKCFSATLALMQMIPRWVASFTRTFANLCAQSEVVEKFCLLSSPHSSHFLLWSCFFIPNHVVCNIRFFNSRHNFSVCR